MNTDKRNGNPVISPVLILSLLLTAVTLTKNSEAFELPQSIDYKGYIENESAYRLKTPHRFSKIQNSVETELNYYPVEGLMLFSKNRFVYDAVYEFVSDYGGEPYRNYRLNWNFKELFPELYLEYALSDDLIITAGRQQVVWGEAVGLKITDLVNPTDLREFILDDFLDSRIGLWMFRLNYSFGESMFEGVVIPDFEPNRAAVVGSQWQMTSPLSGGTPVIHRTEEPGDSFKNSDMGARFNTILNSWDLSLYYLYSWSDNPALHMVRKGNRVDIFPRHHRINTTGGTFNYAFGKTVLSGELALSAGSYFASKEEASDGVERRDALNYMFGAEYILNNFTNVSAQLIQRLILGSTDKLIADELDTTLTLFVQMDFINETVKPNLLLLYGANSGDYIIRPSLTYEVNDNVKVRTGVDIFQGPENSFFGQFSKSDRVYLELKRSF